MGRRVRALALAFVFFHAAAATVTAGTFERVGFPAEAGSGAGAIVAALYRPTGPGPFPAVVAMHGCGGLDDSAGKPSARHADWGERLAAAGYLVLMPDSFASRGATGPQCRSDDRVARASRERVADARAALAFLATRRDVRADRVALMGWSNGASTVLYALRPRAAPTAGPDFRAAITLYPGCRSLDEGGRWETRLPLLMLLGAADDWTPAAPCLGLAATQPDRIEAVAYPGAYHEFDHPNLPLRTLRGVAFSGNGSGVVHTGTNPAARAAAIDKIRAFLAERLK